MSNLIEMPVIQSLDPELRNQVVARYNRLRQRATSLRKLTMEVGWDAAFIERNNGWEVLGFKHQHDCRITLGLGRSNWYRVIAVAQKFVELDEEKFFAMSMENAERLGMEPVEVRYDPENVLAAATMTASKFNDKLTIAGAHREGKPVNEHWVEIKWRIREEQRAMIEQGLEEWQREHGIEDQGYALELLIAEYRDRPTLVGFILESIPRLTDAINCTDEIGKLKGDLAEYLQEMAGVVRLCCGETEEEKSA